MNLGGGERKGPHHHRRETYTPNSIRGESLGTDQADVRGTGKSTTLSWISLAVLEARPTDRQTDRQTPLMCLNCILYQQLQ